MDNRSAYSVLSVSSVVHPCTCVSNSSVKETSMAQVLYPRGMGASQGPVPSGYVEVHRWTDNAEVALWMGNQGTTIPAGVGAGSRIYVTLPGAPQPGGTGPCRIEFFFPQAGLHMAGHTLWRQIFQSVQNVPIYNVIIHIP